MHRHCTTRPAGLDLGRRRDRATAFQQDRAGHPRLVHDRSREDCTLAAQQLLGRAQQSVKFQLNGGLIWIFS